MSIDAPVTAAPPLRSRRALIAARLRVLAKVLAGVVVAGWSLLLIAWLTLHWGILPHIEQWRPQIEERASRALGVPVRIGSIKVHSSRWRPTLELQGVVLLDQQSKPALELPRVVAALSTHTFVALEPRFQQLLIDGAHLEMRRDSKGKLWIAGLDFSGSGGGDNSAANWFFRQTEFVIRGGSLRWTDEQRNAAPLALTDVQFIVRNTLRHHDMRLDATPPSEWGDRFSIVGQFTQPLLHDSGDWQRWSGLAYANLPRANVSRLRSHMTLPFDLKEGDGALRAWINVRDGKPQGATVDVALREVTLQLAGTVEPLVLEQIEGRLAGQRDDTGMAISAQQFGFLTGDGIRWPRGDMNLVWHQRDGQASTGGDFSAQRLDLAVMAQIASRVPLGDAVRKLLAELNPQGIVTNLAARWDGGLDQPDKYQVKGLLSGLSLTSKPSASKEPDAMGRPGLRNATIALDASEKGGEAKLSMIDGAIELPGVFEDPVLAMGQLSALLQWRIEPSRRTGAASSISVQVKDGKFANPDAQGELTANWATGPGAGVARGGRFPGLIEINGKVQHGLATRVARYLPLGLPEDTRLYVQRAVRGGSVDNLTMRIKGDLWDFPFHRARTAKDGEFRVAALVDDVTLDYVPGVPASGPTPAIVSAWPSFSKLTGELIFDRATMEIRNARAVAFGVELSRVQGGIRNLIEKPTLAIDGVGRGPLADMLRFVNASPIGRWTNQALAQASGAGIADLKLALNIPLYAASASTVNGSVALAGNDVRISPDTPLLGAAKARIDFTEKGFSIAGGSARVLGGDATFDGGLQADGSLRFTGQGVATAEALRRAPEIGVLSRLAGSLAGQAGYRLALGFVHGHSEMSITSNLAGMSSDLPAPLRKAADAQLSMRYQTTFGSDSPARDTLRFELGNIVQAQYQRDISGETPRVLRGGIGVFESAPTPDTGVTANINIASINTEQWEAVSNRLFSDAGTAGAGGAASTPADGGSSTSYAPTRIGLRAQELLAGSRRLTQVVAGLSLDEGLWRGNVDSNQLDGYVEYRPARRGATGGSGAGRVYARLARLSLPKSEADSVENLLEQQPFTVPALDIVIDDLELRGKRLGRVEVEAVNRTTGAGREAMREWRLSKLAMTMPEARLSATGVWSAAGASGGRRRVVLDFSLELADSGGLLERLGSAKSVRGGKGSLSGQIAWLGSPLSLDYPSLTGQVKVAIESGQFLKVEPGAARLLSVLSLQSLPRRLSLDFRDLFQEGFAFDNITGDLKIEEGVARTNNLRMRGVQAAVLMEGSADIQRETQDLRVIVVPEINAGTASLAYAAINPAIGLGTFLAQVFLRKPLTQAGTREFHVTGPWVDPKVERVERKLTDAIPDIEAAASPAPAASAPR